MKIGIDISPLQSAHRMRGIGYTTANFITNIPSSTNNYFIFYIENDDKTDVEKFLKNIKISKNQWELRSINKDVDSKNTPKILKKFIKLIKITKDCSKYKFGDSKYPNTRDLDTFLQFDQNQPLPKLRSDAKNYFIAYDLIPYVLEKDYLAGFKTSRRMGQSKKTSLKAAFNRYNYIKKIKLNSQRAHKILAISETTKRDYIKFVNVPEKKIKVITLGATSNSKAAIKGTDTRQVNRYHETSWGYFSKHDSLSKHSFLLFVGGADDRRKLDDLVAAFNQLKASGSKLKLVLSGDIMQGSKNIPSHSIRNAIETSSYKNDIYFLGFTDEDTKNWLYENALTFVFPSIYEGFGLPVLEAMNFHTPVISYENSAVKEVAGSHPIYANDIRSLVKAINKVSSLKPQEREAITKQCANHAKKFTWAKTAQQILEIVSEN